MKLAAANRRTTPRYQQGVVAPWAARYGAVMAALFAFVCGDVFAQTNASSAIVAPDFALRSVVGQNLRLSEYRGQVVAIGFWARWCGDCRQAMKALNEIDTKYRKAGLVTLTINVDDTAEQAAAMARSLQLSIPVLLDERKTVSGLFDLKSMPLIVLIDREGRQRFRHVSYELSDDVRIGNELRILLNE